MTVNQQDVLNELRKLEMDFLASSTEKSWNNGESYYIDTRVKASKSLRKRFALGNREATQENV